MNKGHSKRSQILAIIGGGTLLLVCVAILLAMRNGRRETPLPPVPEVTGMLGEVRVKPVVPKDAARKSVVAVSASRAVAVVCGADEATAGRYEARNDALRSIARRRDLPKEDVAALVAYLRTADSALRVERVAALKNDVMNLLRSQEPPPANLAEALIAMFDGGGHPPAVLDYCVQHLGAMQNGIADDALRRRVREVFVRTARQRKLPCAGTALYSLADDRRATSAQRSELRRLALALCAADANAAARMAAIQLAGERGWREVLPTLRKTLSGTRRDVVLDIVCIGSVGLLGDKDDIALLSRFSTDSRRAAAVEEAIRRIRERSGLR